MKKILALAVFAAALSAHAAPRRVALVVQNHTSDVASLPMAAFADTLAASLSGETLRVVNPHNVIGVNQNRTARGEPMPEASAQEIGRMLNAEGVVTASIQEFTSEDIGVPPIAHTLKVRLALNLEDTATGETVCGVSDMKLSKNYTVEQVKSDAATLFERLMHSAARQSAGELVAKVASVEWEPGATKLLDVFFGCNVLGADVQIDGQSYGTCPAQIALTPGSHSLLVSYPPYYHDFRRRAMFNQDGQTFKVVLQLTPEGEAQRARTLEYELKRVVLDRELQALEKTKNDDAVDYEKKKLELERQKKDMEAEQGERCELFKKQLELADAMLDRYELSGEADDYVRKAIADGTKIYWQNSFGRIAITDGAADNIEFATPSTDASDLAVPPGPTDIGEGLKKLLMKRIGR